MDELIRRDKKKLYSKAINREIKHVVGIDIIAEFPKKPDRSLFTMSVQIASSSLTLFATTTSYS